MMDKRGMKVADIAVAYGVTAKHVYRRLTLPNLPAPVLDGRLPTRFQQLLCWLSIKSTFDELPCRLLKEVPRPCQELGPALYVVCSREPISGAPKAAGMRTSLPGTGVFLFEGRNVSFGRRSQWTGKLQGEATIVCKDHRDDGLEIRAAWGLAVRFGQHDDFPIRMIHRRHDP